MSITSIEELRESEAALAAYMRDLSNRTKSITGRAQAAGRDLTTDETARVDSLMSQFDATEAELRVVRDDLKLAEREAVASVPQPRLASPNPIAGGTGPTAAAPGVVGFGSGKFYAMFPQAKATASREFNDLGSFARAVYERNPILFRNAASGMGEAVGADGGFFVPTQFYAGLMDGSLQQEVIRPGATIIPMTSAQVEVPMFDLSNRSTGIATLEGKTTGEGVTGTTQKAKVRMVSLSARKIQVLVPSSLELLNDAPQLFGGLLQTAMQEALAQTLDTWFFSGNGAGVPLGILNAACTVTQAKDVSQVSGTITPTNIAGMVSRLAPGSWAKSTWICSPSALAALFTLSTVTKNVAGTENVSGHAPEFFTVLPDGKFSLLGRPLVVSDRCAALGTVGDIALCDLSQYLVGIRQNAELAVDTSIGFKESEVWFRLNCRVDGQPAQAAPITPRVGSATLSPFVVLQTR